MAGKKSIISLSVAIILTISTVARCYAIEEPKGIDTPEILSTTESVIQTSEEQEVQASQDIPFSDFVPIERNENEINGEMVITEIFKISASIDPQQLIKPNFVQNGYLYSEHSIIKTPITEIKEKEIEIEHTETTDTKEMSRNMEKLAYSIPYSEDNYVGDLYLDPTTVTLTATQQKPQSSTKTETLVKNLEYNDPSLLPQTYNGLPLTTWSYKEGPYLEGTAIPQYYVYTAIYSKTTSWSVDCAWELSAMYRGTVTYEDTSNIQYTVTYKGIEIPEGYIVVDGELVKIEEEVDYIKIFQIIGLSLFLLILIGTCVLLWWAMKHGLIASRKIIIQAQDDATGEYQVIQKVKVNKKAPAFTLDTLKAPSSKHFLCEMSAKQAKILKGKIIHVSADGRVITKHRVEPLSDTDKYTFPVDLESVESGPIDAFEL